MFQRRPGESIAQFLARETLGFEEFQDALLQLKEEKDGVSPADRLFELPETLKVAEARFVKLDFEKLKMKLPALF